MSEGLAWIGVIFGIKKIENADNLELASVVCGRGGLWQGVVQKGCYREGEKVRVFLPDAILPSVKEFSFLAKDWYRVRMRVIRDVESQVLICKLPENVQGLPVGVDITEIEGVSKYIKPVYLRTGEFVGGFHPVIPKTDEPTYQKVPEMVDSLVGKPYYVSEKLDGMSITVFKSTKEGIRIYTRNHELSNGSELYKTVLNTKSVEGLSADTVIQGELCGPKIQGNVLGLNKYKLFVFNYFYYLPKTLTNPKEELRSTNFYVFRLSTASRGMDIPRFLGGGYSFDLSVIEKYKSGIYENGSIREGVVIRSAMDRSVSFKVLNPKYED